MAEKYITEKESKKRGTYYQVTIKYTDSTGKRVSESRGQFYVEDYGSKRTALKQAVKARDKALQEIEAGSIGYAQLTVSDCFDASLDLFNLSTKSVKRHRITYGHLFQEDKQLLITPITKVTTEDVIRTLNRYADTHSQEAVKRAKTIWHQIFLVAQMKEVPVIDRTLSIVNPKSRKPVQKRSMACTYDDVMVTLDALRHYGDSELSRARAMNIYYMILIMFYTGMRPQEVLALSGAQIDFDRMEIRITQSIGSTSTKTRQIVATKTEESVRTVPIADDIAQMLADMVDDRGSGLLFKDRDGLPYDINTVDACLYTVRRKKKLPRVTLYMCRHLFATDVYGMAQNKKTAQRLLGHKDESTTLLYLNEDASEKQSLVQMRKLS